MLSKASTLHCGHNICEVTDRLFVDAVLCHSSFWAVNLNCRHLDNLITSTYVLIQWWVLLETQVNNAPKCSILYKHIKVDFECEYYLTNLPYNLRLAMSRIRTCNHRLPIEVGRYTSSYKPRQDRICTKCNSMLPGNEFHFILECNNPILLELRGKYISPYYTSQPSMEKLAELFNNRGKKLFKLARYINEGLKIY